MEAETAGVVCPLPSASLLSASLKTRAERAALRLSPQITLLVRLRISLRIGHRVGRSVIASSLGSSGPTGQDGVRAAVHRLQCRHSGRLAPDSRSPAVTQQCRCCALRSGGDTIHTPAFSGRCGFSEAHAQEETVFRRQLDQGHVTLIRGHRWCEDTGKPCSHVPGERRSRQMEPSGPDHRGGKAHLGRCSENARLLPSSMSLPVRVPGLCPGAARGPSPK